MKVRDWSFIFRRPPQERRSEVKSEIKIASRSQIIPFLDQSPAGKENETMISKEQMEEKHGRKKENRIRCRREYAPRTARHQRITPEPDEDREDDGMREREPRSQSLSQRAKIC